MASKIFVNLPVKDLERSKKFWNALGYGFNSQFSDDKGACLVITDDIYAMLLTEPFFKSFIEKDIADTSKTTEVLLALSFDSKEEVDAIVEKALTAGGRKIREVQDYGFMYSCSFEDIDGHIWESLWMDPAHIQASS